MTAPLFRAVELQLPDGHIVVDVENTGMLAKYFVSVSRRGKTESISTLGELREFLEESTLTSEQLASADPVSFAWLLCVLSGRPHYIFPRDSMWPELEHHFGLSQSANQPKVEQGAFVFVAYAQYSPQLKVSKITVDLTTLEVAEETLVKNPWPPAQQKRVVQPIG